MPPWGHLAGGMSHDPTATRIFSHCTVYISKIIALATSRDLHNLNVTDHHQCDALTRSFTFLDFLYG